MTNPLQKLNRLKQITGTDIRFEESTTTTGYLWTVRITFGSHTARSTWLNKREARQQAAQDIIDELTRSGELQEIEETHEETRRQREILRDTPVINENQVAKYTHECENASYYMMFHASDPSLSHIFQTDLNPHPAVGNFAVGIDTEGIRNGYLPALVQITSREITYLIRFTGEAYCERGAQYPNQLQDLFQNPNIVKYVFGNDDYLGPGATNVIDVQRVAMNSELISSNLSRFFGRPLGQPPSLTEVASIVKYLYELQTDREPRRMTRYIKDRELTCSNWFAGELTMEQRRYAASDAQLTRICGMFIPRLQAYRNVETRLDVI